MGILEKEVAGDIKREKEVEEGYKNRSSLTLEDRLRLMFRKDIHGRLSPELTAVSQSSSMALLLGTAAGYGVKSKETYDRFVKDNKHEMFKSPKDAQNILRRDMMKHAGIGALHWGIKLGFFVTLYGASTQTMNVIQNDITGTGHAACGFILGSLFRVVQGPRQMLVAGVVGASLGFVEGIALKGLVWLEHGSYENDMLSRYKNYQAERLIIEGQMKQKKRNSQRQMARNRIAKY